MPKATHGAARRGKHFSEYNRWIAMRQRCRNPYDPHWCHYGGRGVTIDPTWEQFSVFYRDMGSCPPGYTLERVNNDGNYCKENCKWASYTQQNRNTSRTKLTKKIATKIRFLYKTGRYTHRTLGAMFNVSHGQIGVIVRGAQWR